MSTKFLCVEQDAEEEEQDEDEWDEEGKDDIYGESTPQTPLKAEREEDKEECKEEKEEPPNPDEPLPENPSEEKKSDPEPVTGQEVKADGAKETKQQDEKHERMDEKLNKKGKGTGDGQKQNPLKRSDSTLVALRQFG